VVNDNGDDNNDDETYTHRRRRFTKIPVIKECKPQPTSTSVKLNYSSVTSIAVKRMIFSFN